jgi:hypothetical protein
MYALKMCGASAAAITLLTTLTILCGVPVARANPDANDVTRIALDATMRNCDFSLNRAPPMVATPMLGSGWVEMTHGGSRATAVVHLEAPNEPGMHYNVGLIEEPRPSSATCGPGDAGTAFGALDTDGAGVGVATISDTFRPGTTGVWVIIERPAAHSAAPAEYYTSEIVAPV